MLYVNFLNKKLFPHYPHVILHYPPITFKRILFYLDIPPLSKITKIIFGFSFQVIHQAADIFNFTLSKYSISVLNLWEIYYIPCKCGLFSASETKKNLQTLCKEREFYKRRDFTKFKITFDIKSLKIDNFVGIIHSLHYTPEIK